MLVFKGIEPFSEQLGFYANLSYCNHGLLFGGYEIRGNIRIRDGAVF